VNTYHSGIAPLVKNMAGSAVLMDVSGLQMLLVNQLIVTNINLLSDFQPIKNMALFV